MTDNGLIQKVLDKLNDEVIPSINEIKTELALVKNNTEHLGKEMERVQKDVNGIEKTLYGKDNEEGLVGRIKSVEDWKTNRVWAERVVIVAVLGDIVFRIINLL
jgi:hypothetical protein